jgi:hypothetical protein
VVTRRAADACASRWQRVRFVSFGAAAKKTLTFVTASDAGASLGAAERAKKGKPCGFETYYSDYFTVTFGFPGSQTRLSATGLDDDADPHDARRAHDRWTPEARKAHGELTKSKMSDPAVRRRISERTKAGLRAAADPTPVEIAKLCEVWREVSPKARQKFLLRLFLAACSALPAETVE